MVVRVFFILSSLLILSCCANSRLDRLNEYEKSLVNKDCKSLLVEKKYQNKILKGIKSRQTNDVTIADIGATALTFGYNIIENSINKSTRNSRFEEVEEKIKMVNLIISKKEC